MSTPAPQEDNTWIFRKSWTIYDAISEKNYMFHREIYAHVVELLLAQLQRGPYHLIDLGCGNARFLAPCLHTAPPAGYRGVDLSATALEEAPSYLGDLANLSLDCRDMLEALEETGRPYDVIFTGYAVHHLDHAAKERFFLACGRRLAPGGQVLMVDVAREDGQTREEYLDGYLGTMRGEWMDVPPDHLEEACTHVATYDFPETAADLTRMATAAGLANAELIGKYAQHHVMRFTA